eukprot:1159571-Pelagomonas_calceolata.AAC.8
MRSSAPNLFSDRSGPSSTSPKRRPPKDAGRSLKPRASLSNSNNVWQAFSGVRLCTCLLDRVLSRECKKDGLQSPSLAACSMERPSVLKGRAPPHRPRGKASTEDYSSKSAPNMGPTTRLPAVGIHKKKTA